MPIPTLAEKLQWLKPVLPTLYERECAAKLAQGDYEIGAQITNDIMGWMMARGIHDPDQVALMPVFHKGKLLAWASAALHTTETCAIEPGGMPVSAKSRFEEGLNLPPIKIGENFKLRNDFLEMYSVYGLRAPAMFISDLRARCTTADRVRVRLIETEIKRILDDNGMKHIELEFLSDWFLTGEKKKNSDIVKNELLTAASILGARHIKFGDFLHTDTPMPQAIESFAALCKDGAAHGTRIVYELMPFAMIDTLQDTLTMLQGAAAKNGGIIFDLWHVVKLGIPYEDVARFPMEYFFGVEINDGTFTAPRDLVEDTVNHRRLCGEGEFDVPGFLDHVWKAGYRGPVGIEILNRELRKLPLDELVTRSFSTTMAQFRH